MAKAKTEVAAATEPVQVVSIKGLDSNFKCRGTQFEVGKTYSVEGKITACHNGFHAVDAADPFHVWDFYPIIGDDGKLTRYAEVVQSGAMDRQDGDNKRGTKIASASITISAELSAAAYVGEHANRIGSLLKALVEWLDKRPSDDASAILDRIIPLNDAAIEEMELCYRLQSTHRDDLADRERRAIYNPVFFPHMSDEVRVGWEDRYAYCQRRFEARQGRGIGPKAALAIALSNASGVDLAARVAVEGEEAA